MNETTTRFTTGAVRSSDAQATRYDLITPIGLRRLAETYAEGAKKYDDCNWLKGFPANDVLNHAIRHIEMWRSGDRSEDHLAHAAWNLFTLMHFSETRPDLMSMHPWGINDKKEENKSDPSDEAYAAYLMKRGWNPWGPQSLDGWYCDTLARARWPAQIAGRVGHKEFFTREDALALQREIDVAPAKQPLGIVRWEESMAGHELEQQAKALESLKV